jgi:excinuclease Cho
MPNHFLNAPTRKTHPEFDPAGLYEYPQHLRVQVDGLPQTPGVYIFLGEEGDLPLYIGKSVNLRSRVLSHMRTEEEARMLPQCRRITYLRTAGEIGALLLEASLIKQLHPLFNQKLRRSRQLCAWQLPASGAAVPELVFSKDINFADRPRLFGLYSSRRVAVQALQAIADQQMLCYGLLGLEKLATGRGCFRSMLQHCTGACCGKENRATHDTRLLVALEDIQVQCWPYPGAVGLVETFEDSQQVHVIHQWCYLGSADTVEAAGNLHRTAAGFDADGYKILCKPLMTGLHEVVLL